MIRLLRRLTGSGFSVLVTVREANLAPLYSPVDHSLSNDNEYFRGDPLIVQHYCPYPVPEKYQLSVSLHHVSRLQFHRYLSIQPVSSWVEL